MKRFPRIPGIVICRLLIAVIGITSIYTLVRIIPSLISMFDALDSISQEQLPMFIPLIASSFLGAFSIVPIVIGMIVAEIRKVPDQGARTLRNSFSFAAMFAAAAALVLIVCHFVGIVLVEQLVLSIVLLVFALVLAIANPLVNKKSVEKPVLVAFSTVFVGYLAYYLYGFSVYFYITNAALVLLTVFLLITDFEGNKAKVEQPQVKSGPAIAEADDANEKGDAPKAKRKFWTERGMCFSNEE